MSSQLEPEDARLGTVIADRYRLDELLGHGGMGTVYAAEHVHMRKRLAVKILYRELSSVPEVVARFEREAMATANIDHPNVAAASDCGTLTDGSLFLVLELVQGKNLRDEIAAGPMPTARALHVARQIASALAAAHVLGIVHRDLKPENVMLVTRGEDDDFVKVLDFGLAKLTAPTPNARGQAMGIAAGPLTKAGTVFGTPEYMSPEQAIGQTVDARTDIFALGVILYEMLSGVRPFSATSEAGLLGQQLAKPVPTFAERAPGVSISPRVEQVVRRLLEKDISTRYQTADEVVAALDELLPPSPAGEPRAFTIPDGSPTAFLGTAADVYAEPVVVEPPSAPELRAAIGTAGTMLMLDQAKTQELAEPVAEARAAPVVAPKPSAERLLESTKQSLAVVCDFIDASRPRFPDKLRRALENVPAIAIFFMAFSLVWGPTLIGSAWIASAGKHRKQTPAIAASALSSAPPAAPDPLLEEIVEAKQKGHEALEKLAAEHPTHPRVLLALAESHAARNEYRDGVETLKKALSLDPALAKEPAASAIVTPAVRNRDTADAAFSLLESSMGAAGAAILYDLSIDQKTLASTRTRAQKWVVSSPDFLKNAEPSVKLAAQLRYAKSCSDRHDLLAHAGEVGDERALAYMKIMSRRAGCGRRRHDDCFPCLRRDSALKDAMEAIEKRLEKR